MERRPEPPQREFLPQRRGKEPGRSGPYEASKLKRVREDENVLVRSPESPAEYVGDMTATTSMLQRY